MGNFIIDNRIKKLETIKQNLLSLKKNQRGDELQQVNKMIARLKSWNNELSIKQDATVPQCKDIKAPDKTQQSTGCTVDTIRHAQQLNKKECFPDEKTNNYCAITRLIKESRQKAADKGNETNIID